MAEHNSGTEWAYGLARKRIAELEKVVDQAALDLTLVVAKHAIGKDRTVQRMTKYLHKHRSK